MDMEPYDRKHLAAWLEPVDGMGVECDGASRIIATLLRREGIGFRTCVGSLRVDGVGQISDHWWAELDDSIVIDFRARLWLGDDPRVPHGVVVPTADHHFDATGTVMADNPFVFFVSRRDPAGAVPEAARVGLLSQAVNPDLQVGVGMTATSRSVSTGEDVCNRQRRTPVACREYAAALAATGRRGEATGMSSEHAAVEAEILAYYDAIASQDRAPESDGGHFDDLVRELVLVALDRDRDLLACVVRAGIERGRGDAMRDVCRQRHDEVAFAEQAWAEQRGVLTPIGTGTRRTTDEDDG